jgi:hypothetical protein
MHGCRHMRRRKLNVREDHMHSTGIVHSVWAGWLENGSSQTHVRDRNARNCALLRTRPIFDFSPRRPPFTGA